ncbi:hypothetical protein [Pseudoruegeria sp. HB172150]|uniref:hypothetical protein n=1 Tax=Pseudoruegeria sp. HB172150 TaxID=2721164 RepID=UPI001553B3DC|nr:hypothetical protein [Pseudoruegeria sp. HB172150]
MQTTRPLPPWAPRLAAFAILANTTVFVVVNICIYWARAAFAARNPEYIAEGPATISRAISDPYVGDIFAIWVTGSAILLFLGVAALVAVSWHGIPRNAWPLRILCGLVVLFQATASVGMTMLSNFTFHNNHDGHMMGSYIFFAAQAFTVLTGLIASINVQVNPDTRAAMQAAGVLHPGANRVRLWAGSASVALVLAYVTLFVVKDFDLGAWKDTVYLIYVTTEPVTISSFLFFVLLYDWDLAMVLRRQPSTAQSGSPT